MFVTGAITPIQTTKSSKGKYLRYRKIMNDLQLTPETYTFARAFMGGFTHANANYTGKVAEDVKA